MTFRSEISQGIARRCVGNFCVDQKEKSARLAKRRAFSATSTLATAWSYLGNTGDRRLAGIANTGLTTGQFSNFTYTTTPENFISGITESSDAPAVYLASGSQTATYNNLNQLTNLSGQALTFDANGNLTADGQRTYAWDAENRLVGIGYPGVSGKATAFTYDGLSRRATISSTPPGGGSATVTSYLSCGDDICQARDAGNTTIRSYYDEGEYLPGTPAQTLYYGIDQIGSVRRVFASTSSAVAYGYDPYGAPLQVTAPTTDFVYASMFYNADSGLYLTKYRAFDPIGGRWLSRDPLGEKVNPAGNLYPYVRGNPITLIDPSGAMDPLACALMGGGICPGLTPPVPPSCAIPPGWQPSGTTSLLGMSQMTGEPDEPSTDTPGEAPTATPPKPAGIPDNWVEKPSNKRGGTVYVNPNNPNDRVRVMPGNPNSQYPEQQGPYVIDQNNGQFVDKYGQPIGGSRPGHTPQAHIPYQDYIFKR